MMKFLKSLDRFGVAINPKVNKEDELHRSVLGGFVTIILFIASATYGAYVFYKWHDGQLSPKITSTKQSTNLEHIDVSNILQVSFWKTRRSPIDPFKAKGNILTPYLYRQDDNRYVQPEQILNDDDTQLNPYGAQLLSPQLRKHKITNMHGDKIMNIDMSLLFGKCNPKDMREGQYCASEAEIEEFYNQSENLINLDIKIQTLNPLTQQVEISYEEYFYQIENTLCLSTTFFLNSIKYRVRSDLILDIVLQIRWLINFQNTEFQHITEKTYEYIEYVVPNSQTNTIDYCKRAYGRDIYVSLYFATMVKQTSQYQEFPNLGDLLANIGSIASALFMLRHIIYIINYNQLQDQLLNQIIDIYYPEFKKLVYQYNYRRKLISVTYRNKEINIEQLYQFRKRMKQMMSNKLEFSNLIYEISRLQFMIRSFTSRDTIKKLHLIQLKLPFLSSNNVLQFCRTQQIQTENSQYNDNNDNNDKKLLEEDCQIFSLKHREEINRDDILMISDELAIADFFEINIQQEE